MDLAHLGTSGNHPRAGTAAGLALPGMVFSKDHLPSIQLLKAEPLGTPSHVRAPACAAAWNGFQIASTASWLVPLSVTHVCASTTHAIPRKDLPTRGDLHAVPPSPGESDAGIPAPGITIIALER